MNKIMDSDKKLQNYDSVNETLDKMIMLKKSEHKMGFGKRCFLITSCVATVVILITLCIMLYKNNFSMESLLSLLLAFFSIFISIFFYFKADEASNRFYKTSYDFMKDVSVTLGKIEERFGEKLNSLNDKVSHLSLEKEAKTEELETVQDEKQSIIDELMQKAELNSEEKKEYRTKLKEQDLQIAELQHELMRMRNIEKQYMNTDINDCNLKNIFYNLNSRELKIMRSEHLSNWPVSLKEKLEKLGLMDGDGELTNLGEKLLYNMF